MYFLKRKTQQKSETENEAERQKREKKILGETKFESSDNCLWFFKPEIQKSIFIRVWSRNIKSKPVLSRNTEEKKFSYKSNYVFS